MLSVSFSGSSTAAPLNRLSTTRTDFPFGCPMERRSSENPATTRRWPDDSEDESSGAIRQRKWAVQKSIETIAVLAQITLPERARGRPSKSDEPDDPIYRDFLQ